MPPPPSPTHPSLLQNWKQIATEFLNDEKSDAQCLHRWQRVLRPGVKKGPWLPEEDAMINKCVADDITKWSEIAKILVHRTPKQCRERYMNHLDPSIRKEAWTQVRTFRSWGRGDEGMRG